MGGAGRAEDTEAVGAWGSFLNRMMRWLKPIKTALDPSLKKALLYLRTGTGACPYDCFLPLTSPVSPLPSHLSRLPSSRRGQSGGGGVEHPRNPLIRVICDSDKRMDADWAAQGVHKTQRRWGL